MIPQININFINGNNLSASDLNQLIYSINEVVDEINNKCSNVMLEKYNKYFEDNTSLCAEDLNNLISTLNSLIDEVNGCECEGGNSGGDTTVDKYELKVVNYSSSSMNNNGGTYIVNAYITKNGVIFPEGVDSIVATPSLPSGWTYATETIEGQLRIIVTIPANSSTQSLDGAITFATPSYDADSKTTSFSQQGKSDSGGSGGSGDATVNVVASANNTNLEASATSASFNYYATVNGITVTSSLTPEIITNEVGATVKSINRASSYATTTYNIDTNTTSNSRILAVRVKYEYNGQTYTSNTITFTQKGVEQQSAKNVIVRASAPTTQITADTTSVQFSHYALVDGVVVISGVLPEIVTDGMNATLSSTTSSMSSNTTTYNVSQNNSTTERRSLVLRAKYTVDGQTYYSDPITIIQIPKTDTMCQDIFKLNENEISFDAAGGTKTVSFTLDNTLDRTAYLTLENKTSTWYSASVAQNNTISIYCSPNTEGSREATVVLKIANHDECGEYTIGVFQSGSTCDCTLNLSQTTIVTGYEASTTNITASNTCSGNLTIVSKDDWINVDINGETVSIITTEASSNRTGTVVLGVSGYTCTNKSITVTQSESGICDCELTLSKTSLEFNYVEGGSATLYETITASSNCSDYDVVVDTYSSWITALVNGNRLTIQVPNSNIYRTGTVVFKLKGMNCAKKTVYVSQNGVSLCDCSVKFDKDRYQSVNRKEGEMDIEYQSSCGEVSVAAISWINVTPKVSSEGKTYLHVTWTANQFSWPRTGGFAISTNSSCSNIAFNFMQSTSDDELLPYPETTTIASFEDGKTQDYEDKLRLYGLTGETFTVYSRAFTESTGGRIIEWDQWYRNNVDRGFSINYIGTASDALELVSKTPNDGSNFNFGWTYKLTRDLEEGEYVDFVVTTYAYGISNTVRAAKDESYDGTFVITTYNDTNEIKVTRLDHSAVHSINGLQQLNYESHSRSGKFQFNKTENGVSIPVSSVKLLSVYGFNCSGENSSDYVTCTFNPDTYEFSYEIKECNTNWDFRRIDLFFWVLFQNSSNGYTYSMNFYQYPKIGLYCTVYWNKVHCDGSSDVQADYFVGDYSAKVGISAYSLVDPDDEANGVQYFPESSEGHVEIRTRKYGDYPMIEDFSISEMNYPENGPTIKEVFFHIGANNSSETKYLAVYPVWVDDWGNEIVTAEENACDAEWAIIEQEGCSD